MRKHGFYERYYLGGGYSGRISVRRYICKECRRTISLLPGFCHKSFQYCPEIIFEGVRELMLNGIGTSKAAEIIVNKYVGLQLQRQHLNFYRRRVVSNAGVLEYGVRCVSVNTRLSLDREDRMGKARAALLAITESGGFHTFWRKVYVQEGIAFLAHQTNTIL